MIESFSDFNKRPFCQACTFLKHGVKTRKAIPHTCEKTYETFVPRKMNREQSAEEKAIIRMPTPEPFNGNLAEYKHEPVESWHLQIDGIDYNGPHHPAAWFQVYTDPLSMPYEFYLTLKNDWYIEYREDVPGPAYKWKHKRGFWFETEQDCQIFSEEVSQLLLYGYYFKMVEKGIIQPDVETRTFVKQQTKLYQQTLFFYLWGFSSGLQ